MLSDNELIAVVEKKRRNGRIAAGQCGRCGEPRGELGSAVACGKCLRAMRAASRLRMRVKTGSKPWRPGGRGRPPIERSEA
jgi:hypothetical protein